MRRIELELEHHYKNKFVGRHRIKPNVDMTVLGSSREADVRLLGEDINGVHAVLEFQNDVWTLSDLGSERGTWIKKKPIVRHDVRSVTLVNIGGHILKLTPKEIHSDLFQKDLSHTDKTQGEIFHQVIVRKHGFVLKSHLLSSNETFHYHHGNDQFDLKPPTEHKWMQTEFKDVIIQQRLVNSESLEGSASEKLQTLVDPSLKKPFAAAFMLLLLITGLIWFAPNRPDSELEQVKPEINRFSRIIYDAKAARKKREQAKKITKMIKGRSSAKRPSRPTAKPKKVAARTASKKAAKVVNKIKAAGLAKLIGKISKRASKNATFIAAKGRSPDSVAAGPALAAAGTVKGKKGKSFRVKGVATAGKAGGSKSYKGIGGLAMGNVGNASVGILEEETEVEGGLARDQIARVIQSQLGHIRYCYERQLSANPDLYGKILVKFTIGGSGGVVAKKIGLSTLKNAMVEGCILRRIAGWKFPKPKGGTSVLVTYPFLFKSTN